MNLNKEVIAVLLEMQGFKKEHIQFLCGPIIQHRSPWMETTPEWLYKAVVPERLRIIIDEHKKGIIGTEVGPVEIATVMYPATCEAPLSHEYNNIYLWATAHANAIHTGKSVSEIWEILGGDPVRYDRIVKPDGTYYFEYSNLVSDIRRRVVRAQIERTRIKRSPKMAESSPRVPDTGILGEQLSLFG